MLLIVDSVTRFAHAARDVALAAGEPAVARGYAPSVFSDLPKLLERAGPGAEGGGSITGVFSVLVDGDDHNDPVADNIRGTLDGHIVLDRAIADQGRFPAVNVLSSISRLAQHVWTKEQQRAGDEAEAMIARYEDTRDLRLMGGYQPGQDAELDQAVALVPKLYDALQQSPTSPLCRDAFRELSDACRRNRPKPYAEPKSERFQMPSQFVSIARQRDVPHRPPTRRPGRCRPSLCAADSGNCSSDPCRESSPASYAASGSD